MIKKKVCATYLIPVQVEVSYGIEANTEKEMAQKLEEIRENSILQSKDVKNMKFDADLNTQREDISHSIERGQAKLLSITEIEQVYDEDPLRPISKTLQK